MEMDDRNDQKDTGAQDAAEATAADADTTAEDAGQTQQAQSGESASEGAAEANAEDAASEEPQKSEAQVRTEAEVNALKGVFADIRHQSRMSNLVTPDRWANEGMIPDHLDSQQFVDLVFDVIAMKGVAPEPEEDEGEESDASETDEAAAKSQAPAADADGAGAEAAAGASDEGNAADSEDSKSSEKPEDAEQPEPDGALEAIERGLVTIPCADIVSMEGKETMYLYSNDVMTDTYARWAFLANEDDKVATFVECVRQESKTYPRPMIYKGLMNHPFDMTEDEVLDAWKATQETNLYPDIESLEASNGDVYFFSTKYLDRDYAQSLAEYSSVERFMNP